MQDFIIFHKRFLKDLLFFRAVIHCRLLSLKHTVSVVIYPLLLPLETDLKGLETLSAILWKLHLFYLEKLSNICKQSGIYFELLTHVKV